MDAKRDTLVKGLRYFNALLISQFFWIGIVVFSVRWNIPIFSAFAWSLVMPSLKQKLKLPFTPGLILLS